MRTKRQQHRRAKATPPPKPDPYAVPDPFSRAFPRLVAEETCSEYDCCSSDRGLELARSREEELYLAWVLDRDVPK